MKMTLKKLLLVLSVFIACAIVYQAHAVTNIIITPDSFTVPTNQQVASYNATTGVTNFRDAVSSSGSTDNVVYPYLTGIGNYSQPISTNATASTFLSIGSPPQISWNFSDSTGWTQTGTEITISGGTANWNSFHSNTDNRQDYALSTQVNDTSFTMNSDFVMTSGNAGYAAGLSLVDSANHPQDNNHKSLGWDMRTNGVNSEVFDLIYNDGSGISFNLSTANLGYLPNTHFCVSLVRTSATSATLHIYDPTCTTDQVSPITQNALPSTVKTLNHVVIWNDKLDAGGVGFSGKLDNLIISGGFSGITFPASNAVDNVLITRWISTNEVHPWIYVDMGSNTTPAALALNWDAKNSTATQIAIQLSTDHSTWKTVRTVNTNLLVNATWNYLRWDIDQTQDRYVRIYDTDSSAKVLSIWEIKVLKATDSQLLYRHGHKAISSTDGTLSLTS